MNNTLKILTLFLLVNTSCKAQQMVETPNDAYKLKINEQQFVNKPLKNLLKEIKPAIKNVLGTRDNPSYFVFYFISRDEVNHKAKGRKAINLVIYVKETLDWDFNKRPKGKEYLWSKQDVEKYENLTVIRIKVFERVED